MLRVAFKSGLAVTAVYYTKDVGLWGDSTQTQKIHDKIISAASPYTEQLRNSLPFELPKKPETNEAGFVDYYNEGIKSTFHFISMMPSYAGDLTGKAIDTIKKSVDGSSVPSKPQ